MTLESRFIERGWSRRNFGSIEALKVMENQMKRDSEMAKVASLRGKAELKRRREAKRSGGN